MMFISASKIRRRFNLPFTLHPLTLIMIVIAKLIPPTFRLKALEGRICLYTAVYKSSTFITCYSSQGGLSSNVPLVNARIDLIVWLNSSVEFFGRGRSVATVVK